MRRFSFRLFALGFLISAIIAAAASVGSAFAAEAGPPAATPSAQAPDQVIQWNRILLGILRTPGAQPATMHSTRSMAILHAAVYDAVNAIDGTHADYLVHVVALPGASEPAAAAAAAHAVLTQLYPGQQATLDSDLSASLATIPDGQAKNDGVQVGENAAAAILALRANDGSAAVAIPFVAGTNPGDYQLTPPAFAQPVFTQWRFVTPFTLRTASQFRPAPPPALTSATYTADFNEVKSLGDMNSTTRTADKTQIAKFWGAPIQNYWNEIAQTTALQHRTTLAQNARLFALLDLSLADSVIAFYDAKYTYHRWRPITAIRAADNDGNPATAADPNWTPLATTALDPSYPGAHATISAGAALVLASFFGSNRDNFTVTSEVLPGVERSFTSFSDAAAEASNSRIYAGQHFRYDETAGQRLGLQTGNWVLTHFLRPVTATGRTPY
jgi:membrane-associated phospholipid phosphatase